MSKDVLAEILKEKTSQSVQCTRSNNYCIHFSVYFDGTARSFSSREFVKQRNECIDSNMNFPPEKAATLFSSSKPAFLPNEGRSSKVGRAEDERKGNAFNIPIYCI